MHFNALTCTLAHSTARRLLAVAALVVPFTTGKPFYCHQICPHGAAQELISHFRPARFQITLSGPVIRGLENFPFALLGLTLVVALTAIPLDLADLEHLSGHTPADAFRQLVEGGNGRIVAASTKPL